jgi:hypothetical protein
VGILAVRTGIRDFGGRPDSRTEQLLRHINRGDLESLADEYYP